MSNMRIVSNNAIARCVLTALTTAGALVAANAKTDDVAEVWRATGTAPAQATIGGTWPTAEPMSGFYVAHWNASPTARARLRLWSGDAGTGTVMYDSGTVVCNAAPAIILAGNWTYATSASAYAYGGGTNAEFWFDRVVAKSFTFEVTDPDNAQGYVEIAKLVAGVHWSPSRNVAWGASLTHTDRSKNYTMDGSGRTATDFGTRARKMNVSCAQMLEPDRAALQNILRVNGIGYGMWISLDPMGASKEFTRDHSMWAKLTAVGAMSLPNWSEFTAPLEVLEVL